VFAARKVAHAPAVVVHGHWVADRRAAELPGRVAVIAGRKVGNAVARNRGKRRLRAAIAEIGLPAGLDVVAVARMITPAVPYRELVEQVAFGINRVAGGGSIPRRHPIMHSHQKVGQ